MDVKNGYEIKRSVVKKGISFAIIAALAFGAGFLVGDSNQAQTVISRVPLIGDGLDATPDEMADLTDFWKAWNALAEHYITTNSSFPPPSIEERVFGAIKGLAASYNDPHTVYFPPEEAKEFADSISGSFAGIGIEIDVKNGVLTVIAPLKGTPADVAGIKAGDQIAKINDKFTDGLSINKAVSEIRGPVGTAVELTLVRDGKIIETKIVRQIIQVPEIKDELIEENGIYKIALHRFTENSATVFREAFNRFKDSGSKRLILDLRSNPGGYLDSSVDIASHFLPNGSVIVIEDFGDNDKNKIHTSRGYDSLPSGAKMVVLIDGGSASASEILAGALQDAEIATIIGSKSFGKGSVQKLLDLGEGSLKITVAQWITPAGNLITGDGITPDIIVQYTKEDASAERDPQMDRAIQFLTTGI